MVDGVRFPKTIVSTLEGRPRARSSSPPPRSTASRSTSRLPRGPVRGPELSAGAAAGRGARESRPCARSTFASKRFDSDLAAFCRAASPPREISESVARDPRGRPRAAATRPSPATRSSLTAPGSSRAISGSRPREIAAAARSLPAAEPPGARGRPRGRVVDFNRRTLPADWTARNRHGARVGEKFDPIRPRGPLRARRPGAACLHGPHDGDAGPDRRLPGDRGLHALGRRRHGCARPPRGARPRRGQRRSTGSAACRRSAPWPTARRRFPRWTRSSARATPTSARPSARSSARWASTCFPGRAR